MTNSGYFSRNKAIFPPFFPKFASPFTGYGMVLMVMIEFKEK